MKDVFSKESNKQASLSLKVMWKAFCAVTLLPLMSFSFPARRLLHQSQVCIKPNFLCYRSSHHTHNAPVLVTLLTEGPLLAWQSYFLAIALVVTVMAFIWILQMKDFYDL